MHQARTCGRVLALARLQMLQKTESLMFMSSEQWPCQRAIGTDEIQEKKGRRECSNIKALISVHWLALHRTKWPMAAGTADVSESCWNRIRVACLTTTRLNYGALTTERKCIWLGVFATLNQFFACHAAHKSHIQQFKLTYVNQCCHTCQHTIYIWIQSIIICLMHVNICDMHMLKQWTTFNIHLPKCSTSKDVISYGHILQT